jgi:hypothetical protein
MGFSLLENQRKKWNERLKALPEWMQEIFLDDLKDTIENRFVVFEAFAKKSWNATDACQGNGDATRRMLKLNVDKRKLRKSHYNFAEGRKTQFTQMLPFSDKYAD